MKFKESDISLHRAVDNSDPGFSVKGVKLRWVSNAVEARRAGRIWRPLKKSMLPEGTLKKLKESQFHLFKDAEDTIRKRGDVLTFAPIEEVEARRRELRENQALNEARFRPGSTQGLPTGAKTDSSTGQSRAAVEGTSDRF